MGVSQHSYSLKSTFTFPQHSVYRPDKDRLNWLMQALIGGIVTAFMLYIFGLLFGFIGDFLSEIPK